MSNPMPLWTPSPERVQKSQMCQFMTQVADKYGIEPRWEPLRRWAIDHRDHFWKELLDFADVQPSRPADTIVRGTGMLETRWFPGMKLNYARHMLRFDDDDDAIIFEGELGQTAHISHRQLRAEVARCAHALQAAGVKLGDRVGGFMPNVPETVIAMLAAASLGAAWSSCSPDFGVRGVLDRFGQIEPTVLVVTDGYTYGGRRCETLSRVAEMLLQLPSVRRVVVVPFLDKQPDISGIGGAELWRDFLGPADQPAPELTFEEVPFDHPLFIMYSSGTTGVPKCIVHGHGGTLLQHMKELMLHCDLRRGERSFYFTTCGWMMWNWLVSGLGVGAAIVLYEGNPGHITMHRLWELADKLKVNLFGTSPKFLGVCQKTGVHPGADQDLSALRIVCSTGSPLSEELFHWVYDEVKSDVQLASICGGTDIISCFILGNPLLPVYAGEIQCCGLAMDVQAWADQHQPVNGQKAELVCCAPFPSQPVRFWNDPDNAKYKSAYFEHYPGIWRHGDFIEITERGGIIVYGRSDATLNPGGVRIGTAEIYRVVEGMPEVVDSIVVGKDTADDDVEICLFVVLRPGLKLDDKLIKTIRSSIAAEATKRHVPRIIKQVGAIPHTISGKKVEMAVRQMIHGEDVLNRDALANPEALDEFKSILPKR
ncbi:MAG: acetoacetate--CoA ligase [Planctomycetota bacterium]